MEVEEKEDWRAVIRNLLKWDMKLKDRNEVARIIRITINFFLGKNDLYKRFYEGPYLRCIPAEEGKYVMKEIHEGCCGDHLKSRAMIGKALRAGFFWPTISNDVKELVNHCWKCLIHAPLIHIPTEEMIPMSSPCPFAQWGMDLVGPLPMGMSQRKFLTMAMNYFSGWVEAEPLAKITEKVINFLFTNINCRFGITRVLISDNGTQFNGSMIKA